MFCVMCAAWAGWSGSSTLQGRKSVCSPVREQRGGSCYVTMSQFFIASRFHTKSGFGLRYGTVNVQSVGAPRRVGFAQNCLHCRPEYCYCALPTSMTGRMHVFRREKDCSRALQDSEGTRPPQLQRGVVRGHVWRPKARSN